MCLSDIGIQISEMGYGILISEMVNVLQISEMGYGVKILEMVYVFQIS